MMPFLPCYSPCGILKESSFTMPGLYTACFVASRATWKLNRSMFTLWQFLTFRFNYCTPFYVSTIGPMENGESSKKHQSWLWGGEDETDVCLFMARMTCYRFKCHKSCIAPDPYRTMHHSEQNCAHFSSEWCIVRHGAATLWDLWNCKRHKTWSSIDYGFFLFFPNRYLSLCQFTIYALRATTLSVFKLERRSKAQNVGNWSGYPSGILRFRWHLWQKVR